MVLYTKVNGSLKRIRRTEEVFKSGQMVQDTMDSGETEWQTAMVDLCMLKAMSMRVSGLKIKPMVLESTLITMEVDMKVNGSKISNMDTVLSNGQMVQSMRVNTNKA